MEYTKKAEEWTPDIDMEAPRECLVCTGVYHPISNLGFGKGCITSGCCSAACARVRYMATERNQYSDRQSG